MLEEIRRFEEQARAAGVRSEIVLAARYALCAGLDEAVLSTPWGAQSEWAQHPVLVALHREAWGGEKFFEMLDRICVDPATHIDLMELQYLMLALGFTGKYHMLDRGQEQLADLQRNLFRTIRNHRGSAATELSVQWRGLEDRRNRLVRYVPWWVVVAAAVALLAVTFVVYYSRLATQADPLQAKLAQVGIEDFAEPPPAAPVAGPTLKQLLAPEEAAGALSVEEQGGRTVVTLSRRGSVRIRQRRREPVVPGDARQRRGSIEQGARTRDGGRAYRQPANQVAAVPRQLRALARARRQRRDDPEEDDGESGEDDMARCRLV